MNVLGIYFGKGFCLKSPEISSLVGSDIDVGNYIDVGNDIDVALGAEETTQDMVRVWRTAKF